ncbi:MAG: hypothetical protein O7C65_02700, partial [Planctomycetota bacterium]|nr:hypothetical protein [Planctomycetota bacterium]
RRGIAWNRKRAAWWINYDLLCGTGRVLPCFEMRLETLAKTYFDRNRRMGKVNAGVANEEQFAQLERELAKSGPLPPAGLRAALWQLECSSRPRVAGSGSLAADGESSARRSAGRRTGSAAWAAPRVPRPLLAGQERAHDHPQAAYRQGAHDVELPIVKRQAHQVTPNNRSTVYTPKAATYASAVI